MKNLAYFTLENYFQTALQDSSLKGRKYIQLVTAYNEAHCLIKNWKPDDLININTVDKYEMKQVMDCLFLVFKYNFSQQLSSLYLNNMQVLVAANFFDDGLFQVQCPITEKLIDIKELMIRIPEKYIHKNMSHLNIYLDVIKYIQSLMVNEKLQIHDRSFLTLFSNIFTILGHYASKQHQNERLTVATIIQIIGYVFQKIEGKKYRFRGASITSQSINSNENYTNMGNMNDIDHSNSEHQDNNSVQNLQNTDLFCNNDKFEMTKISPKFDKIASAYDEEFLSQKTIYRKSNTENSSTNIDNNSISTDKIENSLNSNHNLASCDRENLVFDDDFIKDAYNLLILLSRMLLQSYNDICKVQYNTNHSYRMLMASLSAIKHLICMCGPKCSNHNMFIQYVREDIYLLLMKIISLSNMNVFTLCLQTFSFIIIKFRKYLKRQIEIYFSNVIISLIKSNTMLVNKISILESLKTLFQDMDIICYFYVNYDCDKRSLNIFEVLVDSLCKQGKKIDADIRPRDQHIQCCSLALECLVVIFWQLNLCAQKYWKNYRLSPTLNNEINSHNNNNNEIHNRLSNQENETNRYNYSEQLSQSFLAAKEKKSLLDNGIDIFNENPIRGLRVLKSSGIIGESPTDIAKFLLETKKLSYIQIGNYLGEPDGEPLQVMYAYVELFNFKEKSFLESLRMLLANFWLPGEAQKIDRIMEKFAGHYFLQNPNQKIFASADVAYILAYSVIMLTTDLHNHHIKNKMTLDQYLAMNSKINDGDDLPIEFLTNIYNSIKEKPIDLKASFDKKNLSIDCKMSTISESTIKQLEECINRSEQTHSIVDIPHEGIVETIFQCIWKQCLVTFSVAINIINDINLLYVPISGVRIAIRVSALLGDNLALDAFLKSLINFTNLSTGSIITEMKNKHIDAIRAVLTVANEDGNYIEENWFDILTVISNLELVQNMANNFNQYNVVNGELSNVKKNQKKGSISGNSPVTLKSLANSVSSHNNPTNNKDVFISDSILETISQSILVSVDRIFSNTKNLDDNSIVVFVKYLCQVSINEINESPQSRTYMLNKIVEIAHYNMDRIRISWSRIWRVLRSYFNLVGCIKNEDIASFCIVSLRQLAFKFLEKEELENFHFQKEFLKPFEDIFARNESRNIKELILKSIDQIIRVQSSRIKSGWTSLLSVLAQAAQESDIDIVRKAFTIIRDIISQVNHLVNLNLRDTAICTLVVFATPINSPKKTNHHHLLKTNVIENEVENNDGFIDDNSKSQIVDLDLMLYFSKECAFIDEGEPSQADKIKLVYKNACSFEPQTKPIVSAFKHTTPRTSIIYASLSRNHSLDNPSSLLRQYSTDSTATDINTSIEHMNESINNLKITSDGEVLNENLLIQREKIAYEVFSVIKIYVEKVLSTVSDFNNPSDYYKNPWITSWIVLFNRLSFLIQNGDGNIANMALKTFNSLLNDYGYMFTANLWQDLITIYINTFTICKCCNKTLSIVQKIEWLNKISHCAFEGITGIILNYIQIYNTETIHLFFDFLFYWIRDVEVDMLSISAFNCIRILLKELLGKVQPMTIYTQIFTNFIDNMIVAFPHNFIPYSKHFMNKNFEDYCQMMNINYQELLQMDNLCSITQPIIYTVEDIDLILTKNHIISNEQHPIPDTLFDEISPIMDYANYTNTNLYNNYKAIFNEKLSSKAQHIYMELNKCQIQVEYMLSLTSLLSFIDGVNDTLKNEFLNDLNESNLKKWFLQLHSIYCCLKAFNNNESFKKLLFSKIILKSKAIKCVYENNSNLLLPNFSIQQSTVAGCLLKYAQVILFNSFLKDNTVTDINTFNYILHVYQEIVDDFCTNVHKNTELWNNTISIILGQLIFLFKNHHILFNQMIVVLYDNLCLLISSDLNCQNKTLLSQIFIGFSSLIKNLLIQNPSQS